MKPLTLIITLFCSVSFLNAQAPKSDNPEVELLLSDIFSSIHSHLTNWENSAKVGQDNAAQSSDEAFSQLKKTISKLKKKRLPNSIDRRVLSVEFEKNLSLLNKRLDATEKKFRNSKTFWKRHTAILELLEKHHPAILKYVSSPTLGASDK